PVPSGVGGGRQQRRDEDSRHKAHADSGGRRGARAATKRTEGVTRHRSQSRIRRTRRSPVPQRGPGRHGGTARQIEPDSVAVSGTTARSDSATCRRKRRLRQGDTTVVEPLKWPLWTILGSPRGSRK